MLNPSRYRRLYGPFSRVRHPRLGHRPRDSHRPCGLYGDRAYRALLAPEETITPEQQANQGNQRAQKTRDWRSCAHRAWIPAMASRSATATPMPPALRSPKIEISEAAKVLMGELRPRLPDCQNRRASTLSSKSPWSDGKRLPKGRACSQGLRPMRPRRWSEVADQVSRILDRALRSSASCGREAVPYY